MNQISVAQDGGLLKLQGALFGKPLDFVVDSGSALEGILSTSVVPILHQLNLKSDILKWIKGKLSSKATTSWRRLRTINCKAEI